MPALLFSSPSPSALFPSYIFILLFSWLAAQFSESMMPRALEVQPSSLFFPPWRGVSPSESLRKRTSTISLRILAGLLSSIGLDLGLALGWWGVSGYGPPLSDDKGLLRDFMLLVPQALLLMLDLLGNDAFAVPFHATPLSVPVWSRSPLFPTGTPFLQAYPLRG